ncbi:hypothetical protein [Chitinophaga rhizophila]|uniref:Uncharacterized protein n=1 Tax=Chitinophaga rhizophila TaxID=2866212 RepID=A0ABS7GD61_9BACT|nr:hypothetical protein [Chitinophaga rhizophila]MBW8685615.1 hypothetical protein [Chitinophaga rhizophila]
MISRDNDIANELRDIIPQTDWIGIKPIFGQVPAGYFDQLPGKILQKVHAAEVAEELETLSPLLAEVPKSVSLSIPPDYFNQLSHNILLNIAAAAHTTSLAEEEQSAFLSGLPKAFPLSAPDEYFSQLPAQLLQKIRTTEVEEELSSLSPLLADMPRTHPLSAPAGYFDNLTTEIMATIAAPVTAIPATVTYDQSYPQAPAPVIRKMNTRRYIKLAIAASLIATVSISTLFFVRDNNRSISTVENALVNVSDQEIMDYLQSHTDAFDREELAIYDPIAEESNNITEVDELPAEAIQHYLDNTGLLKESLTEN